MILRRLRTRALGFLFGLILVGACAAPPPTPTATLPPTPAPTTPAPPTAVASASTPRQTLLADASTIGLASADDGALYAVIGSKQSLYVARSDDGGASFNAPVRASGATAAMVTIFERPTVAAGQDGVVAVSWLEQQGERTRVWLARSDDRAETFAPPEQVAVSSEFETTMVRLAAPPPEPSVAWLQNGSLWLGRASESDYRVAEVDSQVCECCQPAALRDGAQLVLAYRDRDFTDGRETRDLSVAVSQDGGASFGEPLRVTDAPWPITACPISGPALAAGDGRLVVAWMDGRADTANSGLRGDLWVAVSSDKGASFGPNVRVNPEGDGMHNLPAVGIDSAGQLHIVWEAADAVGSQLLYSTSADGGATFSPPQILADDAAGGGRPHSAALSMGAENLVHLAWIDRAGAHILTLAAQ